MQLHVWRFYIFVTMITEKKKSELALRELRGKTPSGSPGNKQDFDSLVEVRAEFIRSKCAERKVTLSEEKKTHPFSFVMLKNKRGDIASVSSDSAVFEPNLYGQKWGSYMRNWAHEEGFGEERIESENLIITLSLEEAVEFLCA